MKFTGFTQNTKLSFCSRRITSWCLWLGLYLHLQPCSHNTTTAASGTCLALPSWLFFRKVVLPDWISNFLAVWHLDYCLILRLKGYDAFHHSNGYRKPQIQAAIPFCNPRLMLWKTKADISCQLSKSAADWHQATLGISELCRNRKIRLENGNALTVGLNSEVLRFYSVVGFKRYIRRSLTYRLREIREILDQK